MAKLGFILRTYGHLTVCFPLLGNTRKWKMERSWMELQRSYAIYALQPLLEADPIVP
jgi:hypothetical protein